MAAERGARVNVGRRVQVGVERSPGLCQAARVGTTTKRSRVSKTDPAQARSMIA